MSKQISLTLIIATATSLLIHSVSSASNYPAVIRVNDGDTLRMKAVFLPQKIYHPEDSSKTMIEMTGRALCVNDICSIPAPTLIVYPGITFDIELENDFDVSFVDESEVGAFDITNLHSHGLHISGEQDNVFEAIFPGKKKTIKWSIHPQHHLGTNWYHAHHHESTLIQVMMGMYGVLIVDSPNNKDLEYEKPEEMDDHILAISWQFVHDNKYCQNCENFDGPKFDYWDSFKPIGGICHSWCSFSDEQRKVSVYNYDAILYDAETNADYKDDEDYPAFEGFLVNNQYQPTITGMYASQWFKLRLVATSASVYQQFMFDYNENTNCKYYLIARDGIALHDISRNLAESPYFGHFLVPPGGRIDVKVFCANSGIANIYHSEVHPEYPGLNESYPMGRIHKQLLFKLDIQPNDGNITDDDYLDYPEPINGFPYYMVDTAEDTNPETEPYSRCQCSNYDRDNSEDLIVQETDFCAIDLIEGDFDSTGNGIADIMEINGVNFDPTTAIFLISKDEMYTFYLNTDGHPFHIHVNPFRVEQDLLNGYIAKKNDWMDTLGYKYFDPSAPKVVVDDLSKSGFKIKYPTRDFSGNVIIHCHFLEHEDFGMMAFMKIVDGPTDDLARCVQDYGFQNDALLAPSNNSETTSAPSPTNKPLQFQNVPNPTNNPITSHPTNHPTTSNPTTSGSVSCVVADWYKGEGWFGWPDCENGGELYCAALRRCVTAERTECPKCKSGYIWNFDESKCCISNN